MEINFDGIPGPTHNYSGLAAGNIASALHAGAVSNPREAALQGLAKMRELARRGFAQAVLPPHERPNLPLLRTLGFSGDDAQVLASAAREAPHLLASSASAAAMWVANAATVSASADTADARVHFTPANLASHLHRAIEAPTHARVLRAIFADPAHFVVHGPLPSVRELGDEGAANHTRFAVDDASPGVDFFVYGASRGATAPARFPARQTREACEALARRHGLRPERVVFARQKLEAIDAGVFHNDVIAVGARTTLFCHEHAWEDQDSVLATLRGRIGPAFTAFVVHESEVALADAVRTYLFNSQLLARDDGRFTLVAPAECSEDPKVVRVLERLSQPGGPFADVLTFDLRQSMRNGGGPACLRLRVPLLPEQRAAVAANVFLDAALARALESWIVRHYRDRLAPEDLADPQLLHESRAALDELTALLALPPVYEFQHI